MSFRDDFLPIFAEFRNLMGPDNFDLRTNKVTLRKITWQGGEIGLGAAVEEDEEILPRPKVVEEGGGRLKVGPITPKFSTGGYTVDTLRPTSAFGQTNVEYYYVLEGPNAGNYALIDLDRTRAFSYWLYLEPLQRRRPI